MPPRERPIESGIRFSPELFPGGESHGDVRRGADHPRAAVGVGLGLDQGFQEQHEFFGEHLALRQQSMGGVNGAGAKPSGSPSGSICRSSDKSD